MKDVATRIKERSAVSMEVVDFEDLLVTSIALEIRKMPERMRCVVKNKMNQVVFKYQITIWNAHQMHTGTPENSFQIFNQQSF